MILISSPLNFYKWMIKKNKKTSQQFSENTYVLYVFIDCSLYLFISSSEFRYFSAFKLFNSSEFI